VSESEHLAESPTSAARALVGFFALALAARAVEKFGWDTYVDSVVSAILAVALVIIAYKLPSIMNRFGREATTKLNRIASDPKWWILIVIVFILQGALWPYVQEKRWPFSTWFPPSPTLDQTATAIADKIPKPLSADEIANAVVGKFPKQSATPSQSAGATPPAAPYVNPLHYEDVKWRITRGLRLWSTRSDPPSLECQIAIIRYPETYAEDYAGDFKEILKVAGWKYTEHLADGTLPKGISARANHDNAPSKACTEELTNMIQNDGRTRSGNSIGNTNLQWPALSELSDFLKFCPSGVGCVEVSFGNEDTTR
jgi:hypothetical protein